MTLFERLAYSSPDALHTLHEWGLLDVYALAAEYGVELRTRARRYRRVRGRVRQMGGWPG